MLDHGAHGTCVDVWLEQSAKGLSAPALARLCEVALSALWLRTKTTLGEVTLGAIGERVLFTAAEKFPFFNAFKVEPGLGIELRVDHSPAFRDDAELRDGIRFLLVELLSVLGNLTAEILTPELHAELMVVTLPKAVRLVQGAEASPGHRKRQSGEGGQL